MDATPRGAFLSLRLADATTLIEKMASNQSWNEERTQPRKRGGTHHLKEVDTFTEKLDLIMKKLEDRNAEKREVMHINGSYINCEECGNRGHSAINYPKIQEIVNYINNNTIYRPQQGQRWNQQGEGWNQSNQGWNQQPRQGNFQGNNNYNNYNLPALRDLVANQSKLLDQMFKKVTLSDKSLENINTRLDSFVSATKNQHNFNKMLEAQLAQLVAVVPPM